MIIALVIVAALGVTASTATTATTETGITATSVKIGGTFPLSGPASLYATIPVAMKAYFSYINARRGPDGKRGVYGRQIIWNYKDDQYSPTQAVQLTRGLSSRTTCSRRRLARHRVNTAIRPYLNSKKVPHMLVSTGATTFGTDWKQYPWTTGWQPNYQFEGKLYGQAIARNSPNAKIAVLYQNDDYGKDCSPA
jgi:branched-chain amino acid transport system substrate-binding protein